jgi:hypothetical protein
MAISSHWREQEMSVILLLFLRLVIFLLPVSLFAAEQALENPAQSVFDRNAAFSREG